MRACVVRAMSTPFQVTSTDGKARCGSLNTRHGVISTPAVLVYTRRGNPVNLTPDVLRQLQPSPQAVQINLMHFAENPDASKLFPVYGKGAHEYLSLEPFPILGSNRDPAVYEYGQRPSSNSAAYVTIHSGGQMVTPERYMAIVAAAKPDVYVTLCDEWLDLCLQAHEQRKLSAAGCLPLAAVAGADSADERGRSAKAAAAAAPDATAGFALCGFGTGEAPEERPALLAASVAHLPANKVRFVSGLTTPWEVLDAVAEGIDLFDTSYVARATSLGYALRFPLQPPPPLPSAAANGGGGGGGGHADGDGPQAAAAAAATASSSSSSTDGAADPGLGQDASKMNLWSAAYRLDKGPLVAGCTCLACRNHTRAYIHHLLHVHEMLADVLLEAHNTHHYQLLMENVKRAIAEGRFEQFRGWFRGVVGGAAAEAAWVPPASVRTGRTGKTGEAVDGGAGADDAAEHLSIGDAMEAEGCLIGAGGGRDATAQAAARGAKRVRHTSLDEQ